MRRITLWLLSTVAVLVLLFSYRTSTMGAGTTATTGGEADDTTADVSPAADGTKVYKGSTADTRWGPVRVSITVANGKITKVEVPTYPNGNRRDQEINAYALPILTQETVDAQSARIDTVSGATVTSDGYIESLQAALDAAGL